MASIVFSLLMDFFALEQVRPLFIKHPTRKTDVWTAH